MGVGCLLWPGRARGRDWDKGKVSVTGDFWGRAGRGGHDWDKGKVWAPGVFLHRGRVRGRAIWIGVLSGRLVSSLAAAG